MRRNPRRVVRAPRIMSKYYRAILRIAGRQRVRRRRARRFASTRWPASSSSFVTRSSDAKDRPYHRRWNFGPVGSRSAGECEFQGACPRGHAAGRRPLPFLFRRGDQPDHRQRQPSAALGQPPRGRLCKVDRHRGGAGRAEARAVSVRRSRPPDSAGSSISARAGCRCGCSTRRAASPTPACWIIWR